MVKTQTCGALLWEGRCGAVVMTQTCGDLRWGRRCGSKVKRQASGDLRWERRCREKVKTQACGDLCWEAGMTHALPKPLTRHCMLTLARLASLPCPLHPCRPRLPWPPLASFAARPLPRLSTNPVSPATAPPPLLLAAPTTGGQYGRLALAAERRKGERAARRRSR